MKICVVVDNLDPSAGWGRLASKIAEGFEDAGHEVVFITEKTPKSKKSNLVLTTPLRLSFANLLRLPLTLFSIRNFIDNCDIVLCYDVNPNGIMLSLANFGGKRKIIIHALATYSIFGSKTPIRNVFMRWVYRKAKKTLVVSEFTKREIEKNGFRLDNSAIVPVGVDINYFHPNLHKERILPQPYILTVAAFKHRKGHQYTLPAFGLISRDFPDLKYVIIGDKSMRSYYYEVEESIKRLNLQDRVLLLDKVNDDDLVRYYNSAELYVQISATEAYTIEGFGIVYLEASACGIPTIGALNTGAESAIKDGKTGILVRQDPEDIARAMRKILSDKEYAKQLGSNGIAWAAEFNWPKVVNAYLDNF